MAKDSIKAGIIIAVIGGVIGGILLLILGNPIVDILTPPEAIPIAQYNEKFCPTRIYFPNYGDKTATFSIKFQNIGDDGVLFVTFLSDKILSRPEETENFGINSTKAWSVNSRQSQDFNFQIKKNEDIDTIKNFTIVVNYGCYENVLGHNFDCKQYQRCCNYQKDKYSETYFTLLNERCG